MHAIQSWGKKRRKKRRFGNRKKKRTTKRVQKKKFFSPPPTLPRPKYKNNGRYSKVGKNSPKLGIPKCPKKELHTKKQTNHCCIWLPPTDISYWKRYWMLLRRRKGDYFICNLSINQSINQSSRQASAALLSIY